METDLTREEIVKLPDNTRVSIKFYAVPVWENGRIYVDALGHRYLISGYGTVVVDLTTDPTVRVRLLNP